MKLPRIRNPLFAASLAIVSFAAFAEPSGMTISKETAPKWTKADSNHTGLPTSSKRTSHPSSGQKPGEIDRDADNKISREEQYAYWEEIKLVRK